MIARDAYTDKTTNPPMLYLRSARCPRPVPDGAPFYACACGMEATVFDRPAALIIAVCEFTAKDRIAKSEVDPDARVVLCGYPKRVDVTASVMGTPTVYHRIEPAEDDGSTPD